jgi:hypothetical protein
MKSINVIKIGNCVKISLNGKLLQKNCSSVIEANGLFRLTLKAKENPTDENIKKVRSCLNEKTRVAILAGLEHDPETGDVFLAGFNTPIPTPLVEIIKEYHENEYPLHPIMNFWKLLMLNPDKRIRAVLFDFIKVHDFVLTDKGYMIVYKAVYKNEAKEEKVDTTFPEFINNRYHHVKKNWKESPKKYVVYKNENNEFSLTKVKTIEGWNESKKNIEIIGNLAELFNAIYNSGAVKDKEEQPKAPVYTDMHTRKMTIELGKPVKQARKECDADFRKDCSNGLHCGSTKYVENFANKDSVILTCLVNPMNVVAVPDYDHSKMRVCEYFPFAISTYENGKINVIEQKYFECDYHEYEIEELEKLVESIKQNEKPIQKAQNAENDEERSMSELLKIIENRIIDIK